MKRTIKYSMILLLSTIIIFACKKTDKPSLPEVITGDIISVSTHSATIGSTVTFDASTPIIARGLFWSTVPNTSFEFDNHSINDVASDDTLQYGSVSRVISELQYGTTYYVKAYATNSAGTAYGEEKSFTTLSVGLPVLSDITVVLTSEYIYTITGTVLSESNGTLTSKGICVSNTSTPTINDKTEVDSSVGLTINHLMSAPTFNATLYVCTYATNEAGTSYSTAKQLSFN